MDRELYRKLTGVGLATASGFTALAILLGSRKARAGIAPSNANFGLDRYPPSAPETVALFTAAARRAGLPEAWASDPALHRVLTRESGGWVGRPNYQYGAREDDRSTWPAVWDEIRRGVYATRDLYEKWSTATGLGQMIVANVDKYYPSGRAGIGVPIEEAIGMLRYISDRYGSPEAALAFHLANGWY